MDGTKRKGYIWAVSAGLNAAFAAIAAKFFSHQAKSALSATQCNLLSIVLIIKYGMVVLFDVIMWACYVDSLRALSSLQATVTNFAVNFLSSGLAGLFLFKEALSVQWFAGALLIVIGVLILSK